MRLFSSPALRLALPLLALMLVACDPPRLLPADFQLPDGSTYSGDLQDGLFHGEGVQVFPDGMVYTGQFRKGYWHGQGKIETVTGWQYEGELDTGMMAGQGIFEDEDSRYEGAFRNNQFHGQGRYEVLGGDVYVAEFAQGNPVRGRHLTSSGSYEGEFRDWRYHGEGTWIDESGRYTGNFVEGNLSGEGEYLGTDGQHYKGEFRQWRFHGEGVLTEAGGKRIEADFEWGQPVGPGTYYRKDEAGELVATEGRWENGVFIAEGQAGPDALPAATTETILAEDRQRLSSQISKLATERPGVADAYFLAVGGDGTESVFKRDIRVAQTGLQARFDVENRSLMLLNHRNYEDLPLATRPSVERALQALDEKLNPEEDLLVIHLVSHGSRDGKLLLQQPGIELPDLTPGDLARMLEPLNTRRKILVVSACFSGHWLNRLNDSDVLIMTSAREDRTSFGCGDDSEMTWFTKAVYQSVGLSLADPDAMFTAIDEQIRAWEIEEGMSEEEWSHPQFYLGEKMRDWLVRALPDRRTASEP